MNFCWDILDISAAGLSGNTTGTPAGSRSLDNIDEMSSLLLVTAKFVVAAADGVAILPRRIC